MKEITKEDLIKLEFNSIALVGCHMKYIDVIDEIWDNELLRKVYVIPSIDSERYTIYSILREYNDSMGRVESISYESIPYIFPDIFLTDEEIDSGDAQVFTLVEKKRGPGRPPKKEQ